MALYTKSYLNSLYNQRFTNLNESIGTRRLSASVTESFDIFLSHSFLDRETVGGLYLELTNQGFKVYVDWIVDPHLDRNNVTKQTAELIRERMKNSKTLLLAISENAAVSKWMPWELGYVDGNTRKCAIIPVSTTNATSYSFNRTEYLLLYPYIKRNGNGTTLYVTEDFDTYVSINDWLRYNYNPFRQTNPIY